MKKQKVTREMLEDLKRYFKGWGVNNGNYSVLSKEEFIKKWRMSPGYMMTMYK